MSIFPFVGLVACVVVPHASLGPLSWLFIDEVGGIGVISCRLSRPKIVEVASCPTR